MASSENGSQFAFGKVFDTDKQTEVDSTPTTDSPVEEGDKQSASVPDNDIDKTSRTESNNPDEEYTDVRSVTIKLVKNQSLYRRVNDKVLPKRADYIGSSINSSRVLSANKEEIETYFPNIIGVAPNNESFITRMKHYLNNIRVRVDELGKTFDTSFHYYKYSDYEQFKHKEEAIESRYAKADKSSLKKINAALKERVTQLNALESSKCRYGYPINVSDYLMYRHCLLYKDIAKDMSIINSDPSIRFYFQDDAKEADKARKYRNAITTAKSNYVRCVADHKLFEAVYIQYCALNGLPIISSLAEDSINKELKLDKFSTEDPVRFNRICSSENVYTIGTIEHLIARGDLIRSQYNQNITTIDGEFVGANMNEAILWFKNPANSSVVAALTTKLKLA
nr:MAG TPA: hypothetical protein [Crassvirales sp.]